MNPFRRTAEWNTARQFRTMTMLSLVCLLALVLISSILYINVILNRNRTYVERIMQQCQSNIEQRSHEALQFVQTLAYDSTIAMYLQEEDLVARNEYSRQVSAFLSNMKTVQPQVSDVFLFREDDSPESFLSLLPNQERLLSQTKRSRVPVILGFFPHSTANSVESMVLYVGCGIYDTNSSSVVKPRIGGVIAAISLKYMDSELSKLTQLSGLQYAVFTEAMTPVCGALPALSNSLYQRIASACLLNETKNISHIWQEMSIAPVLGTQGSLIIYTNRIAVLNDMLIVTGYVLLVTVLMYLLLSYVFHLTRQSVSRPIENVTKALEQHPTHDLPVEGNKDIQVLTETLNRLFAKERQLTETLLAANRRLYESQLAQNKLELQFLRSQINPHFIYNTLEVIRSISIVQHNHEIAEMVKSLAAILRYSIKGGEVVSLKDELHIIRSYLSIQNIRFGSRFEYSMNIQPEAENLMIPRMCLQPLVENAFVHGLENKLSDGLLTITAAIEADELVIAVRDNGVGMTAEKTAELNQLIRQAGMDQPPAAHGVGLINVARRIQIDRGNAFGMLIESTLNEGMSVTLRLPIKKEI